MHTTKIQSVLQLAGLHWSRLRILENSSATRCSFEVDIDKGLDKALVVVHATKKCVRNIDKIITAPQEKRQPS